MPLGKQELGELAQLLERRDGELRDAVRSLRESLAAPAADTGPEVRDPVEDGDNRMAASLDLAQLRRNEAELREVGAARERMREGTYGACEGCDAPIPFARLQVLPQARYCLQHEEEHEKAGTA